MKIYPPTDYIFGIGKIRAIEKSLIRRDVFEEAIEADLDTAKRLFVENALYDEELLHIKNSRQLEELLDKEIDRLRKMVGELILDKAILGILRLDTLELAATIIKIYPSGFLQSYLRRLIDMDNIKTFYRLLVLKEAAPVLEEQIRLEGFIPKGDFINLYGKEPAAFLTRLEYVHTAEGIIDYAYFLREAIEEVQAEGSFIFLEKAISDFLIESLRPAKYISFGPEPLIAYYLARVNEISLVRMIILAKLNDMPQDRLRERLNAVYV